MSVFQSMHQKKKKNKKQFNYKYFHSDNISKTHTKKTII